MTRNTSALTIALLSVLASVGAPGCAALDPRPASVELGPAVGDALVRAHRSGRPLLISTTSKWCIPCKRFLRDAETSPALKQAVSVFERITIDSTAHQTDCRTLRIECFPTFIILSPGGEVLARWVGYPQPPERTAERLVRELHRAGSSMAHRGRPQQAYCLHRWAVQAAPSGALAEAVRQAAAKLVNRGEAQPDLQATWSPSSQLAIRLNGPSPRPEGGDGL